MKHAMLRALELQAATAQKQRAFEAWVSSGHTDAVQWRKYQAALDTLAGRNRTVRPSLAVSVGLPEYALNSNVDWTRVD